MDSNFFTQCKIAIDTLPDEERSTADGLLEVLSGDFTFGSAVNRYFIHAKTKPEPNIISLIISKMEANTAAVPTEVIAELITEFEGCLRNGNVAAVDTVFKKVSVKKTPSTLLVAALRTTYTWKHKVPFWSSFLKRVEDELTGRELDSAKILRGLM